MQISRRQHSNIARVTLITFLINTLLPFFVVYNANATALAANTAGEAELLDANNIIVCTTQGIKLIDLNSFKDGSYQSKLATYPNVASTSAEHQPVNHFQCALCFIAQLHLLKGVTFNSLNYTFPSKPQNNLVNHSPQHFSTTLLKRGSYSRAPPFFS